MRELAKIARVQKIEPITGKDRIELATVENYPVIVQKDEFKAGDLVVYVFYDTVLPVRPEFEFLRARCWSELYQGFRIRNMSMAGVYSSGIVFSLSILPVGCKVVEDKDVSDVLGIRKYDPEALREERELAATTGKKHKHSAMWHWLTRFPFFRRLMTGKKRASVAYPSTVKKSDEENIEKLFDMLKEQHPVARYYVSEKIEGQAMTAMLYGKRRTYLVFSRNTARNPKGSGNWETVARLQNLEAILRSEAENYAIQGEICMDGVQGNIYGFKSPQFFVYKVTNTNTGVALNFPDLVAFCKKHGLTMVPVIKADVQLPNTLKEVLADCEGYSVFTNNGKQVLREGVVWRSMTNQELSFKAKSRTYAAWFESGRKTE